MSADICSFIIYVLGGFTMGLMAYKEMLTWRWYKRGAEEAVNSLISKEDKAHHNDGIPYEKWRKQAILESSVGIIAVFLLIITVFILQVYF